MASIILIGLTVCLILYRIYKYMFYRPPNFPPGPPRLPMVGSYIFLLLLNGKDLHKAVLTLCRWYKSKTIGFYVGSLPVIVCNDYEGVKEILNRSEFDGRLDIFLARMRDPNFGLRGIFFTDGPFWKDQRRFTLRHLRDYGFGRRFTELEIEVRDEICLFLDILRGGPKYPEEHKIMKNGYVLAPDIFYPSLSNAFLKILAGEKLPRDEQGILYEIGRKGIQFQAGGDDYGKLLSVIPWIRHIFPEKSDYINVKEGNEGIYKFIKSIVDKHIETFDISHERNFIDLYIREMKAQEKEGITDPVFHYEQLILICVDFFFPALTAVPVTVCFLIQRLLLQPEVLTKMQKEIDEVVGNGRLPSLDDRINLPYVESSIREIMRLETLVPSAIPHKAMVDTKLMGYDVPQNSGIVAGLFAFHNDPELWGDPHVFRPERFIGDDGKLCLKKDKSLPFGAGKRLCAGETFARNTLFLMVSALAQNFNIRQPPGEKLPDLSKNDTGLITLTPQFWIKFEPR
ncbi:probable cytochrome P450 304a1 [Phlebotomus argentipes]|uniref:probable cytochrome P450 304a1 n=1 Tax=Phlebotomus argentipes TaxID=94469 RepID=UPI002892E3BB|nr:probable cytochrome P450 304a1 [Phlebotomus argentipes]